MISSNYSERRTRMFLLAFCLEGCPMSFLTGMFYCKASRYVVRFYSPAKETEVQICVEGAPHEHNYALCL